MKLIWIARISSCFLLFLININITYTSASIHFDKVILGHNHDERNSPENTKPISSSRTVSVKQNKIQKLPLNNRPRRDHQYATYKVPKNHVLVDYGGWNGNPRQLASSFASTNLLGSSGPQGPPPNEYPFSAGVGGVAIGAGASEEDNVVAAGGHGHSHHHGWGWGHSHGAVGMLGFLGLLALVQNVLRQMNNNAGAALPAIPAVPGVPAIPGVPGKRKRRSLTDLDTSLSSDKLGEKPAGVIPYLLNLNQIREGELLSPECTSYQLCMLSQTASQGMTGGNEKQLLKKALISLIGEMLTQMTRPRTKEKENLDRSIGRAANFGLNNGEETCDKYFKECKMSQE